MLRCNIHFNQLPRRSGCYVVTSISINFQDALLRCNIHFNQLPRRSGCYVVSCNIHFCQLPSCSGCYVVTSVSINFQALWILLCSSHVKQLRGRCGCYVVTYVSVNFPDVLDAALYLLCQASCKMPPYLKEVLHKKKDKIQHLVLEGVSAA